MMNTKKNHERPETGRPFFHIIPARGGLVDVWLTSGTAIPAGDDTTGRTDYGFRLLAVCGIDPEDPQWGGNLEEHVRRNYHAWIESAEVIEI